MDSYPDPIQRKAIDTSGRLGSLYDATRDLLVKESFIKSLDKPEVRARL